MGKTKDSHRIDLHRIFLHAQEQMLANLSASTVFEHPTACGAATEQHWIDLRDNLGSPFRLAQLKNLKS